MGFIKRDEFDRLAAQVASLNGGAPIKKSSAKKSSAKQAVKKTAAKKSSAKKSAKKVVKK